MRRPVLTLVLAAALSVSGGAARTDEAQPAHPPSPGIAPETATATPSPAPPEGGGRTVRSVFGTVMGTIFDMKKKPLSGWMVQLSSRGDDSLLRVTGTNEAGQYVFKDLPAGTYDLEVQTDSEARRKGRIEVKPPFRNIVDFHIGPQTAEKPNPLAGLAAGRREAARREAAGSQVAAGAEAPGGEAAKQVVVRGRFLDAEKRPVSEVSVTLVALEGGAVFQAFSDDGGSFVIPAVKPGRYRAVVFSPGYVPIDLKSIEVPPGSGLNLSLALVDYPLNMKERPEERLPREEPVPAPTPAPTSSPS